jgi:trehalose/maltose transport system substrate-binding protein
MVAQRGWWYINGRCFSCSFDPNTDDAITVQVAAVVRSAEEAQDVTGSAEVVRAGAEPGTNHNDVMAGLRRDRHRLALHRLGWLRRVRPLVLVVEVLSSTACHKSSDVVTLNWYITPDNGGQAELARKCTAAAGGAYQIKTSVLPNDATSQREQLVRRLAAGDSSIDLMSLDPPFVPEFAVAGFLHPFSSEEATALTQGMLRGPLESAQWDGELVSVPFWANTQLLWYRKSVASRAGIDPTAAPLTWDEIIKAAEATSTTVEVQANRYEGYMVWINALVASAGGEILSNPQAGRNAQPTIDSAAGRYAAAVIATLAHSSAADAGLSTAMEESTRAAFQGARGGFMVNWPYIYGAAQEAVAAGTLAPAVLEDIGWARYPEVVVEEASRPPLGGINLAIGAFSTHRDLAQQAVRCITSEESQAQYMLSAKNPAARGAVYDDPAVRKVFPMADLIRDSIDSAAPRPRTPYYTDVSAAVVRVFHPPSSIDPNRTPAAATKLIVDVLHDRVLL